MRRCEGLQADDVNGAGAVLAGHGRPVSEGSLEVVLNSNRGRVSRVEQMVAEAPRGRGSAWAVPRGACLTVRARRRGGECMRQG